LFFRKVSGLGRKFSNHSFSISGFSVRLDAVMNLLSLFWDNF
jgi:hypothetical protein